MSWPTSLAPAELIGCVGLAEVEGQVDALRGDPVPQADRSVEREVGRGVEGAEAGPDGADQQPARAGAGGDKRLVAYVVPRAGEWEVQVGLALSRFENPVTTVRLRVSG